MSQIWNYLTGRNRELYILPYYNFSFSLPYERILAFYEIGPNNPEKSASELIRCIYNANQELKIKEMRAVVIRPKR